MLPSKVETYCKITTNEDGTITLKNISVRPNDEEKLNRILSNAEIGVETYEGDTLYFVERIHDDSSTKSKRTFAECLSANPIFLTLDDAIKYIKTKEDKWATHKKSAKTDVVHIIKDWEVKQDIFDFVSYTVEKTVKITSASDDMVERLTPNQLGGVITVIEVPDFKIITLTADLESKKLALMNDMAIAYSETYNQTMTTNARLIALKKAQKALSNEIEQTKLIIEALENTQKRSQERLSKFSYTEIEPWGSKKVGQDEKRDNNPY